MSHSHRDLFIIEDDGSTTGWACAINDLGVFAPVALQECAAPRGECPRGYNAAFQCREVPNGAEEEE